MLELHYPMIQFLIMLNKRIYILKYLPCINIDVKLSVLLLGHFISFNFATKEVKGVNYFPSRGNDLEICKKVLTVKWLVNSVKQHYLSLRLVWSLFKSESMQKSTKIADSLQGSKNKNRSLLRIPTLCSFFFERSVRSREKRRKPFQAPPSISQAKNRVLLYTYWEILTKKLCGKFSYAN